MEIIPQDELKLKIKLWLKRNGLNYAWLAQKCYVKETTVRNWMARKPIPIAKAYIINGLIREQATFLPGRIKVQEETQITISLAPHLFKKLEQRAFCSGKTLMNFLSDEVRKLVVPERKRAASNPALRPRTTKT